VDLLSFEDEKAYALYSTFRIDDESSKYKITVAGYSGTAGMCILHYMFNSFHKRNVFG
jgi:ficolin